MAKKMTKKEEESKVFPEKYEDYDDDNYYDDNYAESFYDPDYLEYFQRCMERDD